MIFALVIDNGNRKTFEMFCTVRRVRPEIQGCVSQRAVGAVLPSLEAWIEKADFVTYRFTHILIEHGCFGKYLNKT